MADSGPGRLQLLLPIFQPEKSPGMTLAEPVLPEKSDDLRRQAEQTQLVGNGRLGFPQLVRCLLLCQPMDMDQPGDALGFFVKIQVLSLKVFRQSQHRGILIAGG